MSGVRRRLAPLLLLALVAAGATTAGLAAVLLAWVHVGSGEPPASAPVGTSSVARQHDGWSPWDHLDDGGPVRWDPCSPIDLVVNPAGAYPGFLRDLDEAIAEVAEISGLQLRIVDDRADERPHARREAEQPDRYGDGWAPVLVAFAQPGENDLPLLDVDRGLAAPVAVGAEGDRLYVTGQVVLNVDRGDLEPGSDARDGSWGATIRHELGHLVGLDHVDDEEQLMYPHPVPGPVTWEDGDRRGLRALGEGGCLHVPEARPLEVELGRRR